MTFFIIQKPSAVFIRIRKTGSTSIVSGLLEQVEKKKVSAFPLDCGETFCFTFVRNPFDRLVSAFEMFRRYPVEDEEEEIFRSTLTLDSVMDVIENDQIKIGNNGYLAKLRLHSIPMTSAYYSIDRAAFVGRFETFEDDYQRLADQLKIPSGPAHLRKREFKSHYREYFESSTRRRAERLFAKDFETFGYDF